MAAIRNSANVLSKRAVPRSGYDPCDDQHDDRADDGDDHLVEERVAGVEPDIELLGQEPADHRADEPGDDVGDDAAAGPDDQAGDQARDQADDDPRDKRLALVAHGSTPSAPTESIDRV